MTDRPDALVAIGDALSDGQILLVGNVRAEGQGKDAARYYNSVVAIDDKGEIVDAVDKLHLVPGGEYFPFADLFRQIGIDRFVTMPTPFSAGTERHPITVADGLRAAIFICYEIIFPDEVESGVEAPTSSSMSPTMPGSATRRVPTSISATCRSALSTPACR